MVLFDVDSSGINLVCLKHLRSYIGYPFESISQELYILKDLCTASGNVGSLVLSLFLTAVV